MIYFVGPLVQNLTEMDGIPRKRNEILTMAQMTQFDPQSSKITSVLRSDENSTFAHFWPSHEKSWKNGNGNIQESNWDLKSTWKWKSWNLEDQNENSEIEMTLKSDLWFWILNFELDFELESEPEIDS